MALATPDDVLTYLSATSSTATAADSALVGLFLPLVSNLIKDFVGYEIELDTFIDYFPEIGAPIEDDKLIDGWESIGGRVVPRGLRGQQVRSIIMARNLPLREVVELKEAVYAWDTDPPSWPAESALSPGRDFRIDYENIDYPTTDSTYPSISWTGLIYRRTGIWSPVSRTVKVTYKAGYTATELAGRHSTFRLAAIIACAKFVKEAKIYALANGGTGILSQVQIDGWTRQWVEPQLPRFDFAYDLPPEVKTMLEPKVRMSKFMA